MRKRFLLLLFLSLSITYTTHAQHFLDGTWEGDYTGFFGFIGGTKKVVLNLQVAADNTVTGTSHLYYNSENTYEHYALKGKYNPQDSTIVVSEDSVIAVRILLGGTCMGDYVMNLTTTDTILKFRGRWMENDNAGSGCGNSGVWFNKPLPKKPKEKKKDQNLQRVAEIQGLIEIDQTEMDSIKVELRDNSQIDGDMVSVYFNDEIVLHKQKLLAEPITFYVSIPKGVNICNLKMAAESMGSIPPCTAIMNVSTKLKTYEVNLSSSMSNNSAVQFFLKE